MVFPAGAEKRLQADEIVAFAMEYDAQRCHPDEEAGRNSILAWAWAASEWHTCSMMMRDDDRFLPPAADGCRRRAGHRLRQVEEACAGGRRAFRERPGCSTDARRNSRPWHQVSSASSRTVRYQARAETGARIRKTRSSLRRRAAVESIEACTTDPHFETAAPASSWAAMSLTADGILDFAPPRQFDPAAVFTSMPEAAREQRLRRIVRVRMAHGRGVWMKLQHRRQRRLKPRRAKAEGKALPEFGHLPRFRNLRWSKPVYAGDSRSSIRRRSAASGRLPSRRDWFDLGTGFSEGPRKDAPPW